MNQKTENEFPLSDKLIQYVKSGFPPTKEFESGDTDDICRLCGNWCTSNATCSNRYFILQGSWSDTHPTNDTRVEPGEGGVATVPVCDKCVKARGIDHDTSAITILGHKFLIDMPFRMND